MEFFIFMQVVFNVVVFFIAISFIKKQRAEKKDERITHALQLLENKISVLQELSDQVDRQIFSAANLMEDSHDESKLTRMKQDTERFKETCHSFEKKPKSSETLSKVYEFKEKITDRANQFVNDLKNTTTQEPPLVMEKDIKVEKDRKKEPNLTLILTDNETTEKDF